mgnify:FL=1|jgi:BirA family biotin operon repressor/biotin-[acetyl-CoA-carboxylase] ligase
MSTKDKVLLELENNKDKFISGSALAKKLNVSRNAIWKAIKSLESSGCIIDAVTNKGYRLLKASDKISAEAIKSLLTTSYMGREIEILQKIDSTNNYAKEIAKSNAIKQGYTIISEAQTAGKGRMGRSFESPPDTGIYMSIILRPNFSIELTQLLTSCVAVAVADAVDRLYNTDTKIKWVNDLFLNSKKYCGILTEASISFESGQLEYAIIGIGINAKSIKNSLSPEVLEIATSIEDECDKTVTRNTLIAEILNSLEKYIENIESKNFMNEYRKCSFIIGETVIVTSNGESKKALAVDIDDNAGLVVRYENGTTETLNSGEARIIKS